MRKIMAYLKSEDGSLTVESALVTPLLLVVIFLSVLLIIHYYMAVLDNNEAMGKQYTRTEPAVINRNIVFALETGGRIIDELKK